MLLREWRAPRLVTEARVALPQQRDTYAERERAKQDRPEMQ